MIINIKKDDGETIYDVTKISEEVSTEEVSETKIITEDTKDK